MNVQKFATIYLEAGWQVVPLVPKSKRVNRPGWIGIEFKAEDFQPGDNIGLRSTGGLVFVDLDSPECVKFADAFLPETSSVYGRPSKPRSKRIYRSKFPKTIAYKDADRTVLVEIRSNHQDMAPPSVHPSGEVLAWVSDLGEPAEVPAPVLTRAVKLCATAGLVARHYAPQGARHDWCLALSGTLRRRGVSEEEMIMILGCAGGYRHDDKLDDRREEIFSTFAYSDDDYTGATRLRELCTGDLADSLVKLWGAGAVSSSEYELNARGVPDARSIANITLALTRIGAELTFDTFARKPFLRYEGVSALLDDDLAIDLWLSVDQKERFRPSKDLFFDVVKAVARRSSYHPVLDYLASLDGKWDQTPRIETWLTTAAQADNTPYIRAVSSLVLIAAVRRIRQPGVKFDEMVVLESPEQGLLKSTAIRTLCNDPAWFSDDLPLNCDSKALLERTSGKWIIEASDLSGMRASDREQLKSMLSRQVDGPVRLAYARLPVEQPRQFIIIGTTNSNQYLNDHTGNRRFWPVAVREFDIDWLRTHRDQLWAEACVCEANGDPIRLAPSLWKAATSQQSERVFSHPWAEAIAEEYSSREPGVRLSPEDVWNFLSVPIDRRTMAGSKFIANAMQAIGYRRISMRNEEGNVILGWGRD